MRPHTMLNKHNETTTHNVRSAQWDHAQCLNKHNETTHNV